MELRETAAAPRLRARVTEGTTLLLGGGALAGRAAFGLLRLLLAACAVAAALMIPVWIWMGVVIDAVDITDPTTVGDGEIVRLLVLLALPTIGALLVVLLAVVGGATVVFDDVASGRSPRAVRALGRGLRATPRLAATLVPAGLAVVVLAVAAPIVVVAGVLIAAVTVVARRARPAAAHPWPSNRFLLTLVVPYGAAAVLAARWSLLPSVVVLERAGVRAAFRRTRTLSGARVDALVVAVALLGVGALAVWWIGQALLGAGVDALGTRDGWAVVVEGLVVLVVAAIAVRLFVDAGGVSVAAPPPPPPRVHVATVVVFALLAGVVQMVVDVRPASAAVSGATIVVDDLGDDADAAPGDGTCATATTTCTLRAAIEEANTSTDAVIGFAVAGTITVGAELAITAPMTVDGDLAGGPITVSGGGTSRVFFVQIEVPGGGSGAIRNLTIADGYEASVGGAAVYNGAASAGFVLDGVTVRDATVPAGALFGGAVVNVSNLTVRNSTFIGNEADAVTGGSDIANRFAGSATIDNATFTGSQGSTSLESTGASMTVRNSIVAAPTEACVGSITGAGNVTTDLAPTCPGSLATVADLALPPLGANGGPTATVRLPAESSAVGAGDAGTCLPTDQRGVPRRAGRCDAGAYGFDPTTATALTTTPNPSVYGQDVQVDVIVTAVTEPDSPRGTVELRDGATPIGNADVAPDGTATLTVSAPVAGTHPLTAVYLPGAAFTTSTSPMVHHTVDVAGTTTALTSTGSPTLGGQPVTFTVDVTGAGGAVPTGSVDLLDGAASIVTLALDASGRATYTTSGLGGGHHDLTATYPGDANHAGSTSPILEHDVVDSSTTSLAGPAGPTIYGTDAAFVVTVAPTGGGPTPTGSVTLSEGATTVGAATLDGTGQATITVATLAPGDHALTAHYGGDGANGPSSSAAVTHTVTAAATITSLAVSPAGSSVYGNTVTVTATVSSTDSPLVPGGHVQFFDGPTSIGTAELDPTGTGSWTMPSPAVGTYDLHATYLPAAGFAASGSAHEAHVVAPAATTTDLTASAGTTTFGESMTLTAHVVAVGSPGTPMGSVTFRDGGTVLGTASVDGTGAASLITSDLAAGSRTLVAEYAGTANFDPSMSAGLSHTVVPASVLVAIGDTPDPSVFGTTVTIDVTVTAVAPGTGVPTGTVIVRDGATVVATLPLEAAGTASADISGLAVGPHTLEATYVGDGDFAAGTGSTTHTVVADTATVDLVSSNTNVAYTAPVTFTATVTGTGTATPTGTVAFRVGAQVLATVPLDAGGVARLTTATLPYGTSVVVAEYSGDAGFAAASDFVNQTVNATGSGVTLTANPAAPAVGAPVTLTATVVGTSSAAVPTGTVTFFDGSLAIGTVAVDASGQATLTRSFDRSVHQLRAQFTGTPGWSPSTSAMLTLVPDRVTTALSLAGSPTSVAAGAPVTWTATIAAAPGAPAPTGTVELWSGATHLASAPLTRGSTSVTVAAPAATGAWVVTATYDGDLSYEPAATTASVTVAAAATTTLAATATGFVADPILLGALVTSSAAAGPIGGQVRFGVDSPGFSPLTVAVDGAGWAQVAATGIPAGTWAVTATYEPPPGSAYATSSGTASIQVARRPATLTLAAPPTVTVGQPFDVTFALADAGGTGPTPAGDVTVSGGGASCTGTAASGRCSLTVATAGGVTLTATSSGDATHAPATSGPVAVTAAGGTSTLAASSVTGTWVSGDPITVAWRLTGPPSGEVVLRSPFGEVCRSTLRIGSCTTTFPFALRGQTIPIDVTYGGSAGWSAAAATVTGTLVACYPVTFEVVPADAGTISARTGNCNADSGFRDGTAVSVVAEPTAPYAFDRWLEDGSTTRSRSFVVGEDDRSATAVMRIDCVGVTFAATEQLDLGALRSFGGTIDVTPPDCPGRATVDRSPDGAATAWYRRGSAVTLTGTARRPAVDELKGWLVDGALRRTDAPLTVVADDDLAVEGRFGVQCARVRFGSTGGGTASAFTPSDCLDADGFGWQKTSRVGARVVPDAYHWIDGFSTEPAQTIASPVAWPGAAVAGTQMNAWWVLADDLQVDVAFASCTELTLEPDGPGTIEAVTVPNCPTRAPYEGAYYDPATSAEVRAVPNAPSQQVAFERGENRMVTVVPAFLRWAGLEIEAPRDLADPNSVVDLGRYDDEDSRYDPSTGGVDTTRALVDMADDRTVGAEFYDEGSCMPFSASVQPEGAATLDVTLSPGETECPAGEEDLADARTATFRATPATGDPRVGWTLTTADESTDETLDLRFANDGAPVRVKNATRATAYVCTVVQPEITLIAPDGSEVTGPAPPGSDFVQAAVTPDCPLWENAFQVGQTIRLRGGAPPVGYEFDHWEGDVVGDWYEQDVDVDGTTPTIVARAVYRVRCVTVTLQPGDDLPEYSPPPNCPTADGAAPAGYAANELRYIGGTPVMLDARDIDDHDFSSWTGEGLLERDEMREAFLGVGLYDLVGLTEAMDHPAMITADFDMTATANYTEHSTSQKILDDLGVLAKKTVGVLSLMMIGAFESIGLGLLRLGFGAVRFLTNAIDPGAKDTLAVFDRFQEMMDLTELTLLCTVEWSKGQETKDVDIGAFDNNGVVPDVDSEDVVTSTAGLASGGIKLHEAITNYRLAKDPKLASQYAIKIPKTQTTLSGTTVTGAKVAWAGLGMVASLGTAIYSFVADGPGIVWEDTADQAWTTGVDEFEDCVLRHLHEAFPESIPPPAGA